MKKLLRVPATTANLGPGFDTLGLALSIWNESEVTLDLRSENITISIEGFGADTLPADVRNLVVRSANYLFAVSGQDNPGLHFHCRNLFPGNSGLGSSSSAILMGLAGANAWIEKPLSDDLLLSLANEIEGHPDNVTPALLGGLTMSAVSHDRVLARKVIPFAGWQVGVVVPELEISTKAMRSALKRRVTMSDAVFNISRTALVVNAFERGDLELLKQVMEDRIHQPYRLPLISGAARAIAAARSLELPAALSGAGPGIVVFGLDLDCVSEAVGRMKAVFAELAISTWGWVGEPDLSGTQVL